MDNDIFFKSSIDHWNQMPIKINKDNLKADEIEGIYKSLETGIC